ncbi:hypothetical protein FACS1894186_2520 [Alphaproteobacteria bacterium]|nr:hypothetical protein FACS1894186_2520 [Alphaproteobacteria bacterium]
MVDNISRITSPAEIKQLNDQLDRELSKSFDNTKIYLAVPEIIEWQNISGFKYSTDRGSKLHADIAISDIPLHRWSSDNLHNITITAVDANGQQVRRWNAFTCLYAEIVLSTTHYMLMNNEWYKIEDSYEKAVNTKYSSIVKNKTLNSVKFPPYTRQFEAAYNDALHKAIPNSVLMDRKNIQHGGGHSKVELCDVFDTRNHRLFCVKPNHGSSVLSHLFMQGLVSADLLVKDDDFKKKAQKR